MKGRRTSPREVEPRAFEELLSEHLDALYRTASRLCAGHHADAEDLLQEATLRAFDGFAELRDSGAARAWLFQILVRTNINRMRSRRRHPELVVSDLADGEFERALAASQPAATPADAAESADVRAGVAGALDALDDQTRAVIVLVDIEGFRQREAAHMLDIPEGTVASRLFRARCALRDTLQHMRPAVNTGGRR